MDNSVVADSCICEQNPISLCKIKYGQITNAKTNKIEDVYCYTWTNKNLMSVQVMTYGATILNMKVPNKLGISENIVLGFDKLEDYIKYDNYQFGTTIGRMPYAMPTGEEFSLRPCDYSKLKELVNMEDPQIGSFSRVIWTDHVQNNNELVLSYIAEDLEDGYPGTVFTQIKYKLTTDNCFYISYFSTTSKKTPIDLSNKLYMNLAGHDGGSEELAKHVFNVNAKKYVEINEKGESTGKLIDVGGTDWDLRISSNLGQHMEKMCNATDNQTLLINDDYHSKKYIPIFSSRFIHPESGRVLEQYCTHRCVEFSICNEFPIDDAEELSNESLSLNSILCEQEWEMKKSTMDIVIGNDEDKLNKMVENILKVKDEYSNANIPKAVIKTLLEEICNNLKSMKDSDEELEGGEEENEADECEDSLTEKIIQIIGIDGTVYSKNCAFYLLPKSIPGSLQNHRRCMDILHPGQSYRQDIIYKFGLYIPNYNLSANVDSLSEGCISLKK